MILWNPRFLRIKEIFLNFTWKIKLKRRDSANCRGIMRITLKSGTRKEAYYHH